MAIVATALLCLYLPVPFIMLWLHLPAWKRFGKRSYVVHVPVYFAMVAAVATAYPWISWRAWQFPWPARVLGGLLVALAIAVLVASYRSIDSWTAMAGRQISGAPRRVIDHGIYARIRHPRYTTLLLGAVGNALLTGYPLVLAAGVVTLAAVMGMTRVEEAELIGHFGDRYRRYAQRVPRFIPRIRRGP